MQQSNEKLKEMIHNLCDITDNAHEYTFATRQSVLRDAGHLIDDPSVPMTPREWIAREGKACPFCHQTDKVVVTPTEEIKLTGTTLTIPGSCHDCLAVWVETYTLTGYSDLKTPELDVQLHVPEFEIVWPRPKPIGETDE